MLLRIGTRRFGPPDRRTTRALDALADVERIERLAERVLDTANSDELLATP